MKVRNINGTSSLSCPCGTWIAHWRKFSGKSQTYCSEKTCLKTELVGAHVQKVGADNSWYIVPLCSGHNQKAESIELIDDAVLVSAVKNSNCG